MAALRTVAAANVIQCRLASNSGNSIVISRPAVLSLQCTFPSVKALKQQRWLHAKPRGFTCRALYRPEIETKEDGTPQTLDYRVFFFDKSGKKISPWHDIPLQLGDGVFNFVAEIPKESSAKMEVATEEPYTPIKQDTKKGKLRYYPYNINWNYGLLPQTWEDPSLANAEVEGAFGDNDPVDVVEIGERQAKIGEVLKVKPLAALAMIDEGELDWKIVAISVDDPRAPLVNDVNDVEKHFPGTLTAIRNWFRDYKIPDGKPANKFGLGDKPANKGKAILLDAYKLFNCFHRLLEGILDIENKGREIIAEYKVGGIHVLDMQGGSNSQSFLLCQEYALKVIAETNESWAKLVKRSIPAGELSLA